MEESGRTQGSRSLDKAMLVLPKTSNIETGGRAGEWPCSPVEGAETRRRAVEERRVRMDSNELALDLHEGDAEVKAASSAETAPNMILLQEGATAHVYEAVVWEETSGVGFNKKLVAAKLYREDSAQAEQEALREIRALGKLKRAQERPQFVVELLFIDQLGASLPLVGLELCEGGDLFTLLSHGPLTERDTMYYAAELITALDHLRKNEILHGDIKPENIGLTKSGHIRLLDFGTSRILKNGDPVIYSSGTLQYASPEALRRHPCTNAADWWGLGALLYEMLFGQPVFLRSSEKETVDAIVSADVHWPDSPERSENAIDFIMTFLILDAKSRSQSLDACMMHPFMDAIEWSWVKSEEWIPCRFHYLAFRQESIAAGGSGKSFF